MSFSADPVVEIPSAVRDAPSLEPPQPEAPSASSTASNTPHKKVPGTQHAQSSTQHLALRVIHKQVKLMIKRTPAEDVQKSRIEAVKLLEKCIEMKNELDEPFGHELMDTIFNYGVQGLRRIAFVVRKHFDIELSVVKITAWTPSPTRRLRPPADAPIIDKWRWAMQHHLDMMQKNSIAVGVANVVLKLCLLNEPTVLKFPNEGIYPLPELEDESEEWKQERVKYAGARPAYFVQNLVLSLRWEGGQGHRLPEAEGLRGGLSSPSDMANEAHPKPDVEVQGHET